MKQLLALSLAALSMAAVGTAQAQQSEPDAAVQRVDIHAPAATYHLAPHEFDDYTGTYRTNRGLDILFTGRGQHAYVTFGVKDREELVPVASGSFITAAGASITFSADESLVRSACPRHWPSES